MHLIGEGDDDKVDYLKKIEEAKNAKRTGTDFTYSFRDVILYSKAEIKVKQLH